MFFQFVINVNVSGLR